MAEVIDGRKISLGIREKVKAGVEDFRREYGFSPGLAAVIVGKDPASQIYVDLKQRACVEVGIKPFEYELPENTSEEELIKLVGELNPDSKVHGILVQLPLPKYINVRNVMSTVSPEKDVDGLNPANLGRLVAGAEVLVSCTPKGIMRMLDCLKIEVEGKHVVVVSHSTVVGKPLALMLLNRNATVTVCHVKTRDLGKHTREADILVSAAGVQGLIKGDMVKKGAVVIDVGTTKVGDKMKGDVDFEKVKSRASYITPVPGGVGPMTIAMLLENTLLAARKIMSNKK